MNALQRDIDRHPPEAVAETLALLTTLGFLHTVPDPKNPERVLVSPAPKLIKLLAKHGVPKP